MSKCPMTYHMDKRSKIEVPCHDHHPDKCRDKPIACANEVQCLICGMCKNHCVGHRTIREHLIVANTVGA